MSLESMSDTNLQKSENQLPPTGSHKLHNRFRAQFLKTDLCRFFERGSCWRGSECGFAHGKEELKAPPDLNKTSMCKKWLSNECELPASECPFAHGGSELRLTQVYEAAARDEKLKRRDIFCKTQLCRFFEEGECLKGSECEFAHGDLDLRAIPELRKKLRNKEMNNETDNPVAGQARISDIHVDLESNSTDARSRLRNLGALHLQSMAEQATKSSGQPEPEGGIDGAISPSVLPQALPKGMINAGIAAIAQCPVSAIPCISSMLEGLLAIAPHPDAGCVQCVPCMPGAGCSLDQAHYCRPLLPGDNLSCRTTHITKDLAPKYPSCNANATQSPDSRMPRSASFGFTDGEAFVDLSKGTTVDMAKDLAPRHPRSNPEINQSLDLQIPSALRVFLDLMEKQACAQPSKDVAKDLVAKTSISNVETTQSCGFQVQAPPSVFLEQKENEASVCFRKGDNPISSPIIDTAKDLAAKNPICYVEIAPSHDFEVQSPPSVFLQPIESEASAFFPEGDYPNSHTVKDRANLAVKNASSNAESAQSCGFQVQPPPSVFVYPTQPCVQPGGENMQGNPAVRLGSQNPDVIEQEPMDIQQMYFGTAGVPHMVSNIVALPAHMISQMLEAAMPDQYED